MDVLVKNILIGESKRLQFRAEAFNVFNHMVLGVPGTSIAPSFSGGNVSYGTAGVITGICVCPLPDGRGSEPPCVSMRADVNRGGASSGSGVQRFQCALGREVENALNLFTRDVKIFQNLFDWRIFKILENRSYGDTRTAKHPRAANLTGDALHHGAL
jgi:hypothetical protein